MKLTGHRLSQFGAVFGILLLTTTRCVNIDRDFPREPTFTLPAAPDTQLARDVEPLLSERPADQSGFYILSNGIDALTVRLLLAAQAETSIDLQYYLIKNDLTGSAVLGSLLEAADRGVRVRLLLDDVFTSGSDSILMALHSHPNISVRIFNPFRRGTLGRASSVFLDLRRVNRRMHNKSFTVDSQVTVIGGRNIADEYFGARADSRFSDLDVVAVGPVVDNVSTMFDQYWNHETAIPLPAVVNWSDTPETEMTMLQAELGSWRETIAASPYSATLRRNALRVIQASSSELAWAPYTLIYDSPDKGVPSRAGDAPLIIAPLAEAFRNARERALIISPYFVPRRSGVEQLAGMEARGVEVTVVTNSFAANNQFAAHAGYAPSRSALLKEGIDLYESLPNADVTGAELVAASGSRATLHTKAFIIDERDLFIGSFNFDPRNRDSVYRVSLFFGELQVKTTNTG